MVATPTIHVTRERYHLAWDPAIPPIETVPSGSVVSFDMLDASCGQLTADSSPEDLVKLDFSRVDQVNGPIAVEGAEAGDTLEVELLEFEPADWGWTASIPGFGLLAEDFPQPIYRVTPVPAGSPDAEFLPGIRIPVSPFCGEVGVAPAMGPRSTIPPDLHGGNMDTRHLTAGARLFLPVFARGALLSMGDGHAAQGDGEVSGTAIECPVERADLTLDLLPDLFGRPLTTPVADTPAGWVAMGLGDDLDEAAADALDAMLGLLGALRGIGRSEAAALASVVVGLRITQVANRVFGVHALLPHGAVEA